MDQKIILKQQKKKSSKKTLQKYKLNLKCVGHAPLNQSNKEHLDIKQLIMLVHVLDTGSMHMFFYLHQFFFHM